MTQGILDPEIYSAYERAASKQLLAFPGFRICREWQRLAVREDPAA